MRLRCVSVADSGVKLAESVRTSCASAGGRTSQKESVRARHPNRVKTQRVTHSATCPNRRRREGVTMTGKRRRGREVNRKDVRRDGRSWPITVYSIATQARKGVDSSDAPPDGYLLFGLGGSALHRSPA